MWVAANGPDIFAITTSQCLPDASVPRYWDGGQCLPHACVRSRPCSTEGGQMWDIAAMQCVCRPGFHSPRAGICAPCPEASFCANGTRFACPSGMTSPPNSANPSDCACRRGSTLNQQTGLCDVCRGGSWCPNGWDSLPCPGNGDPVRTAAAIGETYPTLCLCAPGSTGVACGPCPDGRYCPITGERAVNYVAMATLHPPRPNACEVLRPILHAYLIAGRLEYMVNEAERRILCAYTPPPTGGARRTPSSSSQAMLVLMLQSTESSNVLLDLPKFLTLNSTITQTLSAGGFSATQFFPASGFASSSNLIAVNTPTACPTGKTPSPDKTACVCRPGYEQAGTQCIACAANRFKAAPGAGVCIACPIGTFSAVAASACIAASAAPSENAPPADTSNTPLIVGLTVGGAVVVTLIGWGIYAAQAAGPATS